METVITIKAEPEDLLDELIKSEKVVDIIVKEEEELTSTWCADDVLGNENSRNVNACSNINNENDVKAIYKCKFCWQVFPCDADLLRHMATHIEEKSYQCIYCSQCYATPDDLHLHYIKMHPSGEPCKCTVCSKSCSAAQETLRENDPAVESSECTKVKHRNYNCYKCQQCSKCYLHHSALLRHMRAHTNKGTYLYQCYVSAERDSRSHMEGMSDQCQICAKVFATDSLLQEHARECVPKKAGGDDVSVSMGKVVVKQEKVIEKEEETPPAEGVVSVTVSDDNHVMLADNKNNNSENAKMKWHCKLCGKYFSSRKSLWGHKQVHIGARPYQCTVCLKSFPRSESLKKHLRTHTGEKPYECLNCGKCFNNSSALRTHERIHTDDRPYNCAFCEKRFIHNCDLERHTRTHTGEKPYKCHVCSKSFTLKQKFGQHMKTPKGKKKAFQCMVCLVVFASKCLLMAHLESHALQKRYTCTFCPKNFTCRMDLGEHIEKHTGEKPKYYTKRAIEETIIKCEVISENEEIQQEQDLIPVDIILSVKEEY